MLEGKLSDVSQCYAELADHPLAAVMAGLSVEGERERLRQNVFRPSHILPTYTIEQAGMHIYASCEDDMGIVVK